MPFLPQRNRSFPQTNRQWMYHALSVKPWCAYKSTNQLGSRRLRRARSYTNAYNVCMVPCAIIITMICRSNAYVRMTNIGKVLLAPHAKDPLPFRNTIHQPNPVVSQWSVLTRERGAQGAESHYAGNKHWFLISFTISALEIPDC